jgi:ribonuclease HI
MLITNMMKKVRIYADGGARGNPGPAAGAAVLFAIKENGDTGERVAEAARYYPHATNNVAEYTGIVVGLEKAKEMGFEEVEYRLDSELAVKQLNGIYRVKNAELAKFFLQIHNLKTHFKKITFTHVRREYNKEADALVNQTIDANLHTHVL